MNPKIVKINQLSYSIFFGVIMHANKSAVCSIKKKKVYSYKYVLKNLLSVLIYTF